MAEPTSPELDDALPHGIPEDILKEALEDGAIAEHPPTEPQTE